MKRLVLAGTLKRVGKSSSEVLLFRNYLSPSPADIRVSPGNFPPLLARTDGISGAISRNFAGFRPHNPSPASGFSFSGRFLKDGIPAAVVRSFGVSSSRSFMSRAYGSWRNYRGSTILSFDTGGAAVGLIAANVAVYFLWRIMGPDFMKNNFMISVENLRNGRLHTLVTSAFSHVELGHLFSNMIGLYFFGTSIERLLGPRFLLNLYIAGAVCGSVCFLAHKFFMVRNSKGISSKYWRYTTGLGASGSVNAIILLDIFLFPRAVHYIQFVIPVPAMLLGAFLIGGDLLRVYQGDPHISGSAHLGGALVAALAWARIRKRWF
ncbi:RHOMBOID-like protein 12, mitochondrial isoform X1 [Nymphaea colorata]|nr:RHOMBOID-like protein 12, mitochondrial isoform X1 [Nymphaea colorata]XP_031490930.1 RHOMBOID-like protein 12, mitochondrial isoform X1 [Nymphaea colorata]